MTPFSFIYVSALSGNDAGSGSIDDPKQTIAVAQALAATYEGSQSSPWGIVLLAGVHDGQIVPTTNQSITILTAGAEVRYSGSGAAVQDDWSGNRIWIEMGLNSRITTTTGNPAVSVLAGGHVQIQGGKIEKSADGLLVENAGGQLVISHTLLLGALDGNNAVPFTGALLESDGETRLHSCVLASMSSSTPVVKSGGTLNLHDCRHWSAASGYVDAPSAQDVQVTGGVSNVACGTNITEKVGSALVDPSFIL